MMGASHKNQIYQLAMMLLMAAMALPVPAFSATPPRPEQEEMKPEEKSAQETPSDAEMDALDEVFRAQSTDPQEVIRGLDAFLARFPNSSRRDQVLRTIFRRAIEANDPRKAAEAAEKLLENHPDDPDLLSAAADQFDRVGDAPNREKSILLATRFINYADNLTADKRSPDVPEEKWPEYQGLMRATAYAMRGRYYSRAGDPARAVADLEKSLAAYASPSVAEQLGDAALQQGDSDRAIDAYLTAFALPDKRVDPARRDQVRQKLGSAYLAKHQTDKGLGDLILARYDELMRTLGSRFKSDGTRRAETSDPLEIPLQKLDGSLAKLSDYRGKIVVMEFWATWCPPCRIESKLFDRVMHTFQDEPRVAFLSINTDEDRSIVPNFVKEEGLNAPVVYAQGLDQLLSIRALPTTLILGPDGRIIFRQNGIDIPSFVDTLESKIREALK
jgi:thiol-disulfide isomerase/thioredoxin